jgi:exodeoxyribonuclease-3
MLSIATWNVNSVKARLVHLLDWLRADKPDIVLLQELKCTDETFPAMEIEELGYNLAVCGQKTYNGVGILSKFPLDDIKRGLPGDEADTHARYIEAVVSLPRNQVAGNRWQVTGKESLSSVTRYPLPVTSPTAMRVASVYVPNGQDAASDKFQYKLKFLDRLHAHLKTLLSYDEMLVVGGDYNIAPTDADVHNPKAWEGSVLTHDEVRMRFRKIINLGMYDAFPLVTGDRWQVADKQNLSDTRHPSSVTYTWWDYRAGAFERDDGLRIDHLLLSPQSADCLREYHVKKELRALEKASDHAPVVGQFLVS